VSCTLSKEIAIECVKVSSS
jgi:hypothetical protein